MRKRKIVLVTILTLPIVFVLQSWTIATRLEKNPLTEFLNSADIKIDARHFNATQFENFVHKKSNKKSFLQNPFYAPLAPSIYIYYGMTQTVFPYRDANLEISALGGLFYDLIVADDNRSEMFIATGVDVTINCPIADQWEARGRYTLLIEHWDGTTMTTIANTGQWHDATTTPTYPNPAITWSGTFSWQVTGLSEYYITLTSS